MSVQYTFEKHACQSYDFSLFVKSVPFHVMPIISHQCAISFFYPSVGYINVGFAYATYQVPVKP